MTNAPQKSSPPAHITSLTELPNGWVSEVIKRAIYAGDWLTNAEYGFPEKLAAVVVDDPTTSNQPWHDTGTVCPADHTGEHSYDALWPHAVGDFVGDVANRVVVDGLTPVQIRWIKAHAAMCSRCNNWDERVNNATCEGDVRSYGAIYVKLRLAGGATLSFVVAVSGADSWIDEEIAHAIVARIKSLLIKEGYILNPVAASSTFIVGADPVEVDTYSADRSQGTFQNDGLLPRAA